VNNETNRGLLAALFLLVGATPDAFAQSAIGANVAATCVANSGDGQTATVGTSVAIPPSVIVRDARGIPMAGVSVSFAVVEGGGRVVGVSSVTTSASGIAAVTGWTLGLATGRNELEATAAGLGSAPVTFKARGTAGAISANRSTLTAASGTASTGASVILKATARDAYNNPVLGLRVIFVTTSSGATFRQPSSPTDTDGVAVGALSATAPGPKTVWAYVGGTYIRQTATVLVGPAIVDTDRSTLAATPESIQAGAGTSSSTIRVTARDAGGNAIGGMTVVLAVTGAGNTLTQPSSPTNASGIATGTLSATIAGPRTVSAQIDGVTIRKTATVLVRSGTVSPGRSTVAAWPAKIRAGSGKVTITVTARDASGNPISGATVLLKATGTANTLTQPAGATDANGVATGILSSTEGGPKVVSATIADTPIQETATITATEGSFPWALAVLGVVGAGAGAAILLSGHGSGGTSGSPGSGGTIVVGIPNP